MTFLYLIYKITNSDLLLKFYMCGIKGKLLFLYKITVQMNKGLTINGLDN